LRNITVPPFIESVKFAAHCAFDSCAKRATRRKVDKKYNFFILGFN
jgi:hypothetical protein